MYQLYDYLEMMRDERRTVAFEAALRKVIRPGDVVLDLGAGTGVLTFIALAAGAARVYAVERSPVIEVARRIAQANGLAERVTFIQADARAVAPPEKVDCLVGDVRGTLPLLGDNIDLFEAVRARWLRPGGATVPLTDELFVAPVSSRAAHERVTGWSQPRAEGRYDAARAFAANNFTRATLQPGDVLASARSLGVVSYAGSTPRRLQLRCAFTAGRDAPLTGLGVWFRGTLADGVTIDTSPSAPPTVYAQGFFPLLEERAVAAGDELTVEVTVQRTTAEPIWTWSVEPARGAVWRESHSTFAGTLLGIDPLAPLDWSRTPSLSDDGQAARAILAAIDGRTSVREAAVRLVSALPDRFPSIDEALPHVAQILGRYAVP